MGKLFISLFLTISLCVTLSLCQSVDDICRFRISGTFSHPNPQRCDLFVQCFVFQSFVRECPTGMIFSSNGNQCVSGDRNTCTVQNPPTITTTIATTTTTVNVNPCAGINLGSIAIDGNCTSYILCILEQGTLVNCDSNEVFDPSLERCVPGNTLTCEIFTTTTTGAIITTSTTAPLTLPITTTTTTTTSTSSTFPTTVSSSTTSTFSTSTPPQPPIGNVCTGNNFRYIPNPRVCFRYYFCLFDIPLPGECTIGRIFVDARQSCVLGNRRTCIPFTN